MPAFQNLFEVDSELWEIPFLIYVEDEDLN